MLKQVKISFVNIDLRSPVQRLPINWLNFKNYYTKNGLYNNHVTWCEPILNYEGWQYEDILDYYDKHDADIYAFSSYLWSHKVIMAIAEELKKRNPKRIIVLGGPHLNITHNKLDWFFENKFVDAICEPTSYGEWFITDMLNQYVVGNIDWKKVAFSIYRTGRGYIPNKINFEFPGPIIPGNEEIIYKCKDLSLELNIPLALPIELTRGCPYECVFCEWGGGIGGKVVRKKMEDIKADLDYIPQFGIEQIQILDANYGIYDEDVQVSLHIEDIKNNFNLPTHVEIYGMTKSKQEKRWKTIEPLARCNVIQRYKLSLQTLNNEVLKNIKRTDIARDKDFEFAQYLFDSYGVRSDFEFMMGLPGYKRQDFYDEIDIQYQYGYSLERYIWLFLPDSPAYSPDYIKEFGIKTIKTCIGKSRMNSYIFDDVKTFGDYHVSADPRFLSDVEFVVEAEGFDRKDYTEFFFMNFWILENPELFDMVREVLEHNNNSIKSSVIFKRVYENIINSTSNRYALAMKDLNEQMYRFILGERQEITDFKQFNLPFTDTSVDVYYIHKACMFIFENEYLDFFITILEELDLQIPENMVSNFKNKIEEYKNTPSPKYDNFYQIRTFYKEFIDNEKY